MPPSHPINAELKMAMIRKCRNAVTAWLVRKSGREKRSGSKEQGVGEEVWEEAKSGEQKRKEKRAEKEAKIGKNPGGP